MPAGKVGGCFCAGFRTTAHHGDASSAGAVGNEGPRGALLRPDVGRTDGFTLRHVLIRRVRDVRTIGSATRSSISHTSVGRAQRTSLSAPRGRPKVCFGVARDTA